MVHDSFEFEWKHENDKKNNNNEIHVESIILSRCVAAAAAAVQPFRSHLALTDFYLSSARTKFKFARYFIEFRCSVYSQMNEWKFVCHYYYYLSTLLI